MSPGTAVIVNLLGGVALLLWGVRMVRTGVTRAWGERLQRFLEHRVASRFTAFGAGAAATLILGSGTATGLIVSNIAAAGTLATPIGLAMLLGADVGSATATTFFASGTSLARSAVPLLLLAGYVTFSLSREFRPHNVGRILIGLGLMMLALNLITTATQPLNGASLFHDVLTAVGRETLLAFAIGALMAWMFHSTLAAILVVASLVSNNSMALDNAAAFVIGINVGGGMPALLGSLSLPPAAKRMPAANMLCRSIICIAALPLIGPVTGFVSSLGLSGLSAALSLHLGINVAAGLIWLPFVEAATRLTRWLLPDGAPLHDSLAAPRYLDRQSLGLPALALANATQEATRMSEVLDLMFSKALEAMASDSTEALKALKLLDQRLNTYQDDIRGYLAELAEQDLNEADRRRALEITLLVSNLEHAGDIVQLNLGDRIKAKVRESIRFTASEQESLDQLTRLIRSNIKQASAVMASRDVNAARQLIEQKDAFRQVENSVINAAMGQHRGSEGKALRKSALFVDIIRDLHRLNSHIVAAGYPIVDAAGLLRSSRLRSRSKP